MVFIDAAGPGGEQEAAEDADDEEDLVERKRKLQESPLPKYSRTTLKSSTHELHLSTKSMTDVLHSCICIQKLYVH